MKWKSKLISSSLPLEFEAAKMLASKRFAISADYSYARNDSGVVKDFSVDLYARAYLPFSKPEGMYSPSTASLELLVECKQRVQNISWLFFPSCHKPFFAYNNFGYTLHAEDQFSQLFFPIHATAYFEKVMFFCYKGTEINEKDGSVYDAELRHGIAQLQYALPRLYTERVLENTKYYPADPFEIRPFLFCSILITTANLFVAHESLVTADVEKSSSLKDIAYQVPYLIYISDYGPDFKSHCLKEFTPLADLPNNKTIKRLDGYRKKYPIFGQQLPSVLATSLAEGQRSALYSHFTHFVVCTMENFPSLITHLKRSTTRAVRNLTTSPKP